MQKHFTEEEVQAYLKFFLKRLKENQSTKNLTISRNVFQYMNNLNQKT